jgi:hypothetical protein
LDLGQRLVKDRLIVAEPSLKGRRIAGDGVDGEPGVVELRGSRREMDGA